MSNSIIQHQNASTPEQKSNNAITLPLFDIKGTEVSKILLPERIVEVEIFPGLLHEVITAYLANRRVGTASTKTRSEVSGGGRKPWRQKGTGRARHGSIRSPLWRKGGVVFGPKPRSYRQNLPKKKFRKAVLMAMKIKAQENNIFLLKEIDLSSPKTSKLYHILKDMKIDCDNEKTLFVYKDASKNLKLSARNIPNLCMLPAESVNAYDILRSKKVIFTEAGYNNLIERIGSY